jgi:formiminoglutamate deiminase
VTYWCEHAWLESGTSAGVRVDVRNGRIASVEAGVDPRAGDERLGGVVMPGLANAHAHGFHRALRGRTQDRGGSFWSWREQMYAVAAKLDPDSCLALARATYAELALGGVTCVAEFSYLHHAAAGRHYDDPNAMGHALEQAAAEAGVRLTLLDTCYLAGGLAADGHMPLDPVQQRFSDGDASAWAQRIGSLSDTDSVRHGAAIHSVRAVPADQLPDVVAAAEGRPLHVHLSEQPAENAACLAFHGCSPTALLAETGALGPRTTAVHATHVDGDDITLLGTSGTAVCACPTTEADLADGIGPFRRMVRAGSPLCLGSDQQVHSDLLAEARCVESYERLSSGERGRFSPTELMAALTRHDVLGWPDAGAIAVGKRADLVAVRNDTPRTAGCRPDQMVTAASAADVHTVVVDGRVVVREGGHVLGDVGALLTAAIEPLWADA